MGRRWVAITDNADPQMHVLVYRREAVVSGPRLVCAEPVFAAGMGATENSLIGVGTRSLVVENNYGYSGPTVTANGGTTEPGITRIDLGTRGCHTVWTSAERVPSTVSKVSLGAGLEIGRASCRERV